MADNAPNFDAMTPEEIMAWMESLAKRQGADSSTFTTAADMQVAEVSADDERAKNVGEYVPFEYRNKPDEWRKKVAAEEEAKKQRAPAPAAAVPPPAPAPAKPAAAAPPPAPMPAPAAKPVVPAAAPKVPPP